MRKKALKLSLEYFLEKHSPSLFLLLNLGLPVLSSYPLLHERLYRGLRGKLQHVLFRVSFPVKHEGCGIFSSFFGTGMICFQERGSGELFGRSTEKLYTGKILDEFGEIGNEKCLKIMIKWKFQNRDVTMIAHASYCLGVPVTRMGSWSLRKASPTSNRTAFGYDPNGV